MPVMKRLTVDGVNYDTVGEASVTQVQTSGTKIATVTIDGTATDLYAPEGDPVTMEDSAVDAAVDAAWPIYSVTISLTNPLYGENFNNCQIKGYADGGNIRDILGSIIDPAGSTTVEFDAAAYEYLSLMFDTDWGESFTESNITCAGGVSYYTQTTMGERLFVVTGSGTITIDGIDYGD